jgi:uncharacterized protein (DUF2141 family)
MIAKLPSRAIGHAALEIGLVLVGAALVGGAPQFGTAQEPGKTAPAAPATYKLSGRILKASGKYDVHVALWQADGFLEKQAKELRIKPGEKLNYQFEVAAGRWAVSAYEDTNGNGVLDMGRFGPKEPSGFWQPFNGWRKPRFDDVSVQIDRSTSEADITLR